MNSHIGDIYIAIKPNDGSSVAVAVVVRHNGPVPILYSLSKANHCTVLTVARPGFALSKAMQCLCVVALGATDSFKVDSRLVAATIIWCFWMLLLPLWLRPLDLIVMFSTLHLMRWGVLTPKKHMFCRLGLRFHNVWCPFASLQFLWVCNISISYRRYHTCCSWWTRFIYYEAKYMGCSLAPPPFFRVRLPSMCCCFLIQSPRDSSSSGISRRANLFADSSISHRFFP